MSEKKNRNQIYIRIFLIQQPIIIDIELKLK